MKRRTLTSSKLTPLSMLFIIGFIATASAVQVGEPAPNFGIVDSHGKTQHLSDYKGKFVVLEWHSQACWAVKRQYDSGNMQRLQKDWTSKGVVWLTVMSSAPGNPGFVTPSQENTFIEQAKATPTAALMDTGGTLGHLYGVKNTPEMFVIDPQGTVIYEGAIDDHHKPTESNVATAKNYVSAALEQAMAGKPVAIPGTISYGCSVNYKN